MQVESIGTSYADDDEFLRGCHLGAGYKENEGVINVKFSENAETPPAISEE